MELLFVFNGIQLINGQMPRALVTATFALSDVPDTLPTLEINLTIPICPGEQRLEETARIALQSARSLVNGSAAVQWMQSLPTAEQAPLCDPPDALQRLQGLHPLDE